METEETVGDWVAVVDSVYPERSAESWDSVGLQVGDPNEAVSSVLVCLDVTGAVLDEAGAVGAELVVAHHPLLLRALERVTPETASGRLALRAAREGIAVMAAHTNFDVAADGTTEPIVRVLGLTDVRALVPAKAVDSSSVKLVTFVPGDATADVLAALAGAGAGVIGEYSECAFRVAGTGSFRPSGVANPAVGARGQRNEVAEDRVEIVVPRRLLGAVVEALVAAHPYEEVAYDVYPLVAPSAGDRPKGGPAHARGLGRVGELPEPVALHDLAGLLAEGLPSPHLRYGGDGDRQVRRVAACGGAGDSLIGAAVAAGADVYVTGDLRHHVSLDALTLGMAVVDAGHYATEAAALPTLEQTLKDAAAGRGLRARLVASSVRTEPLSSYQRTTTT